MMIYNISIKHLLNNEEKMYLRLLLNYAYDIGYAALLVMSQTIKCHN